MSVCLPVVYLKSHGPQLGQRQHRDALERNHEETAAAAGAGGARTAPTFLGFLVSRAGGGVGGSGGGVVCYEAGEQGLAGGVVSCE